MQYTKISGHFVEEKALELASLNEQTGSGTDHWSISGWVGVLVVLTVVIGIVIYFKRKIVE